MPAAGDCHVPRLVFHSMSVLIAGWMSVLASSPVSGITLCRPMSRDIFVQDSPGDVQAVAEIPDGRMRSPLPFGRGVVTSPQIGGARQA
jgi:hypothetical protein